MLEMKISVSQRIVDDIRTAIISQDLRAGDKLPTERELAEQYGLSRIPVREALKVLAQMGLIITQHGKGSFIREPDSSPLVDKFMQPTLSNHQSLSELIILRKLIESQAARDAADNRTEADLKKIDSYEKLCIKEYFKVQKGILNKFSVHDYGFHLAIAEASGNNLFVNFLKVIECSLREHQSFALRGELITILDKIIECHSRVHQAIRDKNSEDAGKAMEDHMQLVSESMKIYTGI